MCQGHSAKATLVRIQGGPITRVEAQSLTQMMEEVKNDLEFLGIVGAEIDVSLPPPPPPPPLPRLNETMRHPQRDRTADTISGPLAPWSACSGRLLGGCRLMGVWA